MSTPDLRPAKTALRREMAARRRRLTDEHRARATEALVELLLAALSDAGCVALYAALPAELDLGAAARRISHRGGTVAFPRVVRAGHPLAFHAVEALEHLRPGHVGILEPTAAAPSVPLTRIDAVVCPGLAFDRRGVRLGWGKGYYDRTLASAPAATRIGVCFAAQLVDNAPFGHGDAAMDCVITEEGVVPCGRRAETE